MSDLPWKWCCVCDRPFVKCEVCGRASCTGGPGDFECSLCDALMDASYRTEYPPCYLVDGFLERKETTRKQRAGAIEDFEEFWRQSNLHHLCVEAVRCEYLKHGFDSERRKSLEELAQRVFDNPIWEFPKGISETKAMRIRKLVGMFDEARDNKSREEIFGVLSEALEYAFPDTQVSL